jgi:hypothetical protein
MLIVTEVFSLDSMMSNPDDTMDWVTSVLNDKEGAYQSEL